MQQIVGRSRRTLSVVSALTLVLVGLAAIPWPTATAQGGTVTMEYLGWSHYRFTSVTGKVILTNPWVSFAGSTVSLDDVPRADLILVADGHGDEVGDSIAIAQKTGARIVAVNELSRWFREVGVPAEKSVGLNPGNELRFEGITIRAVNSVHGSGISARPGPTAANAYGGPALGYFITFENGWTVYFAGSTAATADQALWAEMYRPDVAILPLNNGRSLPDFAMMVKLVRSPQNGQLKSVFLHHHFPPAAGQQPTPDQAQAAANADLNWMTMPLPIISPGVRQVYSFAR